MDRFIDELSAAASEFGAEVLLPLNDYTTIAVSEQRTRLPSSVSLALPPHEDLQRAQNKYETSRLAQRLGVRTPRTWLCGSPEDLEAISEQVRYPCVMKLVRGAGAIGMRVIQTRKQLLRAELFVQSAGDNVFDASTYVIQEWLDGGVYDVCALFRRGEPRAALVQERCLMYPAHGGVGVWNRTVKRPELIDLAFALLRELNWHGPAQVEFLVDQDDQPHLIEINGRFWGTLALATEAGIDFASLTCEMAQNGDVEREFDYEVGLGFRWPIALGLLHTLTSSHRLSSLWQFLAPNLLLGCHRSEAGVRSDWRLVDPLPQVAELSYLARIAWQRRSLALEPRRPPTALGGRPRPIG